MGSTRRRRLLDNHRSWRERGPDTLIIITDIETMLRTAFDRRINRPACVLLADHERSWRFLDRVNSRPVRRSNRAIAESVNQPGVVPDQMQSPKLHRSVPAQPPATRGAIERPRLPAQQRQPVPEPHRNVAQPPARELSEPQIVVLVHERVPTPTLIRARQPHLNLVHHHLHLVERIRHASFIGDARQNSQPSALLSGHHRFAASVK